MTFVFEPKLLKNILNSVKEIVSVSGKGIQQVILFFNHEGLKIICNNDSRTIFMFTFISKESFTTYTLTKDTHNICLDNEKFLKLLSTNDVITMSIAENLSEITLQFGSKVKSKYKLNIISIEQEEYDNYLELSIPDMEFGAIFSIQVSTFKQIIERMNMDAGDCKINCLENELNFEVVSNKYQGLEDIDITDLISYVHNEDISSKFNMNLLGTIFKSSSFASSIEVSIHSKIMSVLYQQDLNYIRYYFSSIN